MKPKTKQLKQEQLKVDSEALMLSNIETFIDRIAYVSNTNELLRHLNFLDSLYLLKE